MKKFTICALLAAMAITMPSAAQTTTGAIHEPLKIKQVVKAKRPAMMRTVKKAAPAADLTKYEGLTIYANLTNSDDWSTASIGAVPYGVYTYKVGTDETFKAVSTALDYNYMASAYARDMLFGVRPMSVFGALTGVSYEALDTLAFKMAWRKQYLDNASYGLIPSAMAYDVTSDIIYSAQYNDELSGLYWAKFNRVTRSFDIMNKWNNDFQPLTMAVAPDGRMFAIDVNGYYYQIDKANGDASMIGETGVTPTSYVQQMSYEPSTGTFVWAAVTNGGSAIYAVDVETGAASLIATLNKNEQCSSVFFKTNSAKAKAPAAVTDLKFAYSGNGATTGNITFTVPAKAYDGTALNGDVEMNVYLDGKALAEATMVAAGAKQTFAFDVTNDNHYAYVSLKNDGGLSPTNYLYEFAGYDTPLPVTDVKLNVTNGKAKATWTAPAGGVNKGYIDNDKLYYQVLRMPDSTVVADNLKATTYEETLPSTMERYYYRIIPFNGADKKGDYAESNRELSGSAFSTPYADDFSDESTLSLWTITDANNDKCTWSYNQYSKMMSITTVDSRIETASDDWLTSPGVNMEKGYTYELTVNLRNVFAKYPERVKLLIGTDPKDLSTFSELDSNTAFDSNGKLTDWTADYQVEANNVYYIAIYCDSKKDENCSGLFIQKVSIDKLGVNSAPAAVSNLSVTATGEDDMKAELSFDMPAKTLGGDNISAAMSANIYRDNSTTAVANLTNLQSGANVKWTDDNVTTVGEHTYTVAAVNADGEGKKTSITKFIGIYTPTYTETFDTDKSATFYSVEHNQQSSGSPCNWTWNSYNKNLQLSYYASAAGTHTWLFLPAIKMEEDAVYNYSFVWSHSIYSGSAPAYAGVGMAADSTSQKLIQPLPTTVYGVNPVINNEIITDKSGKYYPSIYVSTETPGIYLTPSIDSVVVRYVTSAHAPYSVENLKAEHDMTGAMKATVSFKVPSVDYAKRTLTENVKVDIYRGEGSSIPVKTYTDVKPGEEITWNDDQPIQGNNIYMVVPSNSYGRGRAINDTTFVGIDTPPAVSNLKIKGNADNQQAILTWEEPTTGINDGVLDNSLSYVIAEYFPAETDPAKQLVVIDEHAKGTTYTVTRDPSDEMEMHYYGIISQSSAGIGKAVLDYAMLGKLKDLPFKESFANGATTNSGWISGGQYTEYGAWAIGQDDSEITSQDGDNGHARYYNGSQNQLYLYGDLVTPKSKVTNAGNTELSFWVYRGMAAATTPTEIPCLIVSQSVNDDDFTDITEKIDVTEGETGWQKYTVKLKNLEQANFVKFRFRAYAGNMNERVWVDNIVVSDNTGTGISDLNATGNGVHAVKGGIATTGFDGQTVSVYGVGGILVDSYTSTGNDIRTITPGVYVVKVGDNIFKMNVGR